jgi:hypothetical protein
MALSAGSTQGTTISRFLNKLKYAFTDVADDITTATTSDIVVMLDASDNYTPKYADADNLREMTKGIVSIADAATYTVLAANTGKTHVIPNLTADCTIDLPTAAAGLEYRFITNAVATDGQNWIFDTMSATNYYTGGLQFLDSDEPGSGSTLVPVYPDGNSNDIMTIITPQAGTYVHVVCDGTNWIVNGVVFSATAPTFAD